MPNFEQPPMPSPEEIPEEEEKEIVEGDGFSMKEGDPLSRPVGPALEFRPGETSETAQTREEKEKAEEVVRERLRKEYQKAQAEKMTPEEKAKQEKDMVWRMAEGGRKTIMEWFEDRLKENGEYSETLGFRKDGKLDYMERFDDHKTPFIIGVGDVESPEDLYQLLHKIEEENPQFNISVDIDPKGKWIKYSVSEGGDKNGEKIQ